MHTHLVLLHTLFTPGLLGKSPAFTPRRTPCGETTDRICYGVDGGESQRLLADDVRYVADYLRHVGRSNEGAAQFWTMPSGPDCAEWTLPIPGAGSVLALAKHIDPKVNSSVLYEDLARAVDGGEDASPAEAAEALLGSCGTHGGQKGVEANLLDPLYHTKEYVKSGAVPRGVLVKLVRAPERVVGTLGTEL
ncbi:hypothetical protein E4U42_001114 [Claviceps africana]|uniref:Uncharacterized protein n=1 Tax=Claviceps africana TaxID=83212 RepID=A0A8K0J042_9HYPO|nr:hypothetical protein E4U42_001114 [Claviceps africana]